MSGDNQDGAEMTDDPMPGLTLVGVEPDPSGWRVTISIAGEPIATRVFASRKDALDVMVAANDALLRALTEQRLYSSAVTPAA